MRLYKLLEYSSSKGVLNLTQYDITPNDYHLVNIITKQGYAYVASKSDFDNDVIFDIDFQKDFIGFNNLTIISNQVKIGIRDEKINTILERDETI